MARVIVLQATGTARQVHLSKLPFSVGRAHGCDLVLDNPQVSRLHACFHATGDGIEVVDAGSNNGTWVNGRRVKRSPLFSGDELRLGSCMLRFLADGGDLSDTQALRLVTAPGRLDELDLRKLAPRQSA
ncbi:FHA domain-containing protein [Xenophilus aerolatus]|nr:FHA domain-containing protein [Xenophilus aerolatus]